MMKAPTQQRAHGAERAFQDLRWVRNDEGADAAAADNDEFQRLPKHAEIAVHPVGAQHTAKNDHDAND